MKFFKEVFLRGMVVEWSEHYVDYKHLKDLILDIRSEAFDLAKDAEKDHKNVTINLSLLNSSKAFWQDMNKYLEDVDAFYHKQLKAMSTQFHDLTKLCIQLKLIEEFKPRDTKFSNKLDRELLREGLSATVVRDKDMKKDDSLRTSAFDMEELNIRRMVSPSASRHQVQDSPDVVVEAEEVAPVVCHTEVRTKQQLNESFLQFYRGQMLLESYCDLNYQAIRKILKKYDKFFGTQTQITVMESRVQKMTFYKHSALKLLVSETEHVYALAFTGGHRSRAMDKLRVPQQKTQEYTFFRLGSMIGFCIPLLALIIYMLNNTDSSQFAAYQSVLICYRMMGMLILMLWCWGIDMYIWTKFRVNYVFIFEFDPRYHIRFSNMLEAASLFTVVYLLSIGIYILGATQPADFEWLGQVPYQVWPLTLLGVLFAVFIYFQIRSGWWLTITMFHIVTAPFHFVRFRDFFVGDQLVSIAIVLYDFEYTACFFLYDSWKGTDNCAVANIWVKPLIATFPATWRLLQCLRRFYNTKDKIHLVNGLKYTCSIFVVLFSALRTNVSDKFLAIWLIFVIISTCYSYTWDIIYDWGLGHREHGFLRAKLIYQRPEVYYFAMVTNFCMRLMWTLTISPDSISLIADPFKLSVVLSTVEILRRAQWNVFRLENEQLNNSDKFRAFDVVVPPIDQVSIEGVLGIAKPIIRAQKQIRGIVEDFYNSLSGKVQFLVESPHKHEDSHGMHKRKDSSGSQDMIPMGEM